MSLVIRLALLASCLVPAAAAAAVYQGNGIKIGEVTAESAVIWTRLTTAPEANWSGTPFIEPSLDGNREALKSATAVARESAMSAAAAQAEKATAGLPIPWCPKTRTAREIAGGG